jgi:hypothetical protein
MARPLLGMVDLGEANFLDLHSILVVTSPSQMSRFLGPFLCGGPDLEPFAGVGRPWQWAAGEAIWWAAVQRFGGGQKGKGIGGDELTHGFHSTCT